MPKTISGPILITGAAGFLGNAMVTRFQKEYECIHALIMKNESVPENWGQNVKVFRGDVRNIDSLRPAIEGVTAIFHHAAVIGDWGDEDWYYQVDVQGTDNLIQLALPLKCRFFLTSSITVNGDEIGNGIRTEDQPFGNPLGPYSRNKQKQELLARSYIDKGLKLTVIRPGNITGAGSQPWVHDVLVELKKSSPVILGGGNSRFGLCHVDNVVEVFARAAATESSIGQIYYALDDCANISWKRYVQDLARIAKLKPPKSAPVIIGKVIALIGENLGKALRFKNRPPLTREAFNLITVDMEFSQRKVINELGYQPIKTYHDVLTDIQDFLDMG